MFSSTSQISTQTQSTTLSTNSQSSSVTKLQTSEPSTWTSLTPSIIPTISTTGTQTLISTAKSSSTTSYSHSQTIQSSCSSSFGSISVGSETLSASGSTITAPLPAPYTIRTVYQTLTKDLTFTKTAFAEAVTTATYLTVHESNLALVSTCVPITILYSPCYCEHQVYPSLAMTTIISPCSACGSNGENLVTLTVPEAACETGSGISSHPIVQFPDGWTEGYQTDKNGNSYLEAQFTAESQGDSQHNHGNGQLSIPTPAAESYSDSQAGYNGHPSAPVPTAGSQSNFLEGKNSHLEESAQPNNNDEPHPTHPMTLTTEIATTGEIQATKSTDSLNPSQPGQADSPYTTLMPISGGHRFQSTSWMMMAVMLGIVLLLE
ncbi:hypothetical protein FBEOM_6882 [Fusarium beomiforme]|uniref:Uncharacterized protein n=1 Tax=Fusarium beomiforme TaxID=44412 RepID=A0A9P5AI45_9HYPO|nr:hypothetical protein FBEOM_6882 [Fusarium beomiforme]